MADLQKLVVRLEAETARYQRELDGARRKLAAFDRATQVSMRSMRGFKSAFVGLGTGALVHQLASITKGTLDYADSVAEASDALGISTKAYQELQYATSQAGIKQEQFTASFSKFVQFAQDAAQGKKGPAEVFSRLGITAQEAGDDVEQLFNLFSERLDSIPTQSEKLQILGDAFGSKVAAKWAATFAQGKAGLDEMRVKAEALGLVLSDRNIRAMGQLGDAVDTLGIKFKVAFAEGLAEGLVGKTGELSEIMRDPAFAAAVDNVAGGFKAIGRAIGEVPSALAAIEPYTDILQLLAAGAVGYRVGGPVGAVVGVAGTLGYQERRDNEARANPPTAPQPGMSMISDGSPDMSTFGGYTPEQLDAMVPKIKAVTTATGGHTAAARGNAAAIKEVAEAFDFQAEKNADAADEFQRVKDIGRSYLEVLDQLDGGTQAFKNEQEQLNLVLKAGWINQDQYTRLLEKAGEQLDTYANAVKGFSDNLQNDIKSATGNLFQNLITDSKNWKDHLIGYLGQIGDAFAKMAADMATQAIFGTTGAGGGGGGGFDWAGLVTGLVGAAAGAYGGGATAGAGGGYGGVMLYGDGGMMPANQPSIIGENGPELVMPRASMRVFSNDETRDMFGGSGGGGTVIQNFAVKDFDSFKRSERQMRQHGKAALGLS